MQFSFSIEKHNIHKFLLICHIKKIVIISFFDKISKFQVDAHVSKHLFKECIEKFLTGKTKILATHQVQYIEAADCILLVEQGKIQHFSCYQELLQCRPEYRELLATKDERKMSDDSSIEKSMKRQISTSSTRVSKKYKI